MSNWSLCGLPRLRFSDIFGVWQGGLPASFTTNSVGDNVAGRVCPLPHCPTDTINNSYRQEETNSRDKFLYLSLEGTVLFRAVKSTLIRFFGSRFLFTKSSTYL